LSKTVRTVRRLAAQSCGVVGALSLARIAAACCLTNSLKRFDGSLWALAQWSDISTATITRIAEKAFSAELLR
jgi:hypothetical protein